jgi:hypothetical protein
MANMLELDVCTLINAEISEFVRHDQTIDGRKCSQNMNLKGKRLEHYRSLHNTVERCKDQLREDAKNKEKIFKAFHTTAEKSGTA